MAKFIGLRLARVVGTVWLLVTLVYFALQLAPGDPTDTLISAGATPEVIAKMRRDMGLDRPLWQQYISYLGNVLRGDFGRSWRHGTPVTDQIKSGFVHTLVLALSAMVVATFFGLMAGLMAGVYSNGTFDVGARFVALVGISSPIFVINLAAMYLFAFKYPIFPTSGSAGWQSLVLPAVTLGLFVGAMMLRLVRSATLEVLARDYVRAVHSRGIPRVRVIARHIVPNILVTVVTLIGVQFGLLLGGSVITETVFAWPGLGQMTVLAIKTKDIPIVQGTVTVFAASFMFINFIVDIVYPLLDPRILITDR
jgi:ABC-type dipeptide/oligopeptide/nickel transport system permease component